MRWGDDVPVPMPPDEDADFMDVALEEAQACLEWGDVPIGAAIVARGVILSRAGNQREHLQDPTAHAEILAIRAAAEALGSWRLLGCTIYVTLEPCAMCAGALVLARVARLVFGATDPKAGFVGSLGDIARDPRLNHRLEVTSGVGAAQSAGLLREFFAAKRRPAP
jgi:tRNA(adenine34) deaminase